VEIWEDEKGMEAILPPQNKLVQDSEQNEESRYPVQTPTKKDKLYQRTQ
jgi:hypothetical protein